MPHSKLGARRAIAVPAPLLAAVVATAAILSPGVAPATDFPKVPHVENLTEGFRVEKTFSTVAVAPSDPDQVYLGTDNGYVYTSTDGGETWDQHDLVEMPRRATIALRPRTGLTVDFGEFMTTDIDTNPTTEHFAGVYNWPKRIDSTFDGLQFSDLARPESFRPSQTIRSDLTVIDEFVGETFDRLTLRALRLSEQPTMAPDLGHGRRMYRDLEAREKLHVRWLVVHPENADVVYAVTNDGLWLSEDAGYSWGRAFDDAREQPRDVGHFAFSPTDPDVQFLCTKTGLYSTTDGGDSYTKVSAPIINRIPCNWIAFHPERPRELWVGAVFGLWVSKDFGQSFDLKFGSRIPGQKAIRQVRFDPDDANNVLLGSTEYAFVSRDGGDSFREVGTYSFGNQRVATARFGDASGTMLVATRRDLWRSNDWGETWQSMLFGNVGWALKHAIFPRGRDGPIWLLTDGELLELRRRQPTGLSDRDASKLRDLFQKEPSLSATMVKALEVRDVWRPDLRDDQRAASLSNLAPNLQVVATHRDIDGEFLGRGRLYGRPGPSGRLPRGLGSQPDSIDFHLEIWTQWELGGVVFDRESLPTHEHFEFSRQFARSIRQSIQLVYAERRRLQIKQVSQPADDLRTRLFRRLRVRELTELLDIMTDGWFSRYRAGAR